MSSLGIEKAESLESMLGVFITEPLDESTLPVFYYGKTMAIRNGKEGGTNVTSHRDTRGCK